MIPPQVGADALDDPFWEGCRRRQLLVHRCGECQRSYWPATSCTEHGWAPMAWVPAVGTGEVHTYTVFHHAVLPALADRVPYVVAVVQLDEGPFFHTDVLDCDPADVHVGQRVEVVFEDAGDGWVLPHFRPARPKEVP